MPAPSRLRRALYLSLPSILFVSLLGGMEAAFRRGLPRVSSLQLFVTAPEQHLGFTDRFQVGIFEGDPLLFWRLRPNLDRVVWDFTVVSTNGQGLRHRGEVGPKAPGAFRIVCLGDSVAFGYRVPLVFPGRPRDYDPRHRPYPAHIEEMLRAANPGRAIEVVALAVPGYTSYQGLAWLRRDIRRLRPDVVTACFGWNDVNPRAVTDRVAMRSDPVRVALRSLAARSQAVAHLALWLRSRRPAAAPTPPVLRVPREEYVSNMIAIVELARRHGASVAVIGPVYRDAVTFPEEAVRLADHRRALRAALGRLGIPYLEIPELTESHHPANDQLFGEVIHPNHLGHRLMAGAVLAFMNARGLLGGLTVPPDPP